MNDSAVETPRAVIVVSSHVARGSVGNRAAVFALETLGHPVWAVPTVLLPWHPGHGPATRIVPDAEPVLRLHEGSGTRAVARRGGWRALRLSRRRPPGGRRRRTCSSGQGKEPQRDLYLRPGDGRRRRALRSRGDGRGDARPALAARRHRHAQPLRTRMDRRGENSTTSARPPTQRWKSVRRACW